MSLLVLSTNVALADGGMQLHPSTTSRGLHHLNMKEIRKKQESQHFNERYVVSVESEVDALVAMRRGRVARLLSIRGGSSVADLFSKVDHFRLPELSLSAVKIFLQLGLSILNIMCWIIPMRSQNFTQNKYALGVLKSHGVLKFQLFCPIDSTHVCAFLSYHG